MRRAGISRLISEVLVITAVIALGVLIYLAASSYFSGISGGADYTVSASGSLAFSNGYITVTITNTGNVPITVNSFTLVAGGTTLTYNSPTLPQTINPGEKMNFMMTVSGASSSVVIQIDITDSSGNFIGRQITVPLT